MPRPVGELSPKSLESPFGSGGLSRTRKQLEGRSRGFSVPAKIDRGGFVGFVAWGAGNIHTNSQKLGAVGVDHGASLSINQPAFCIPGVAQAVVQPARPALPELDRLGYEAVTAPVVRPGNRSVGEAIFQVAASFLEFLPTPDNLALRRGPCADARARRTAVKVLV